MGDRRQVYPVKWYGDRNRPKEVADRSKRSNLERIRKSACRMANLASHLKSRVVISGYARQAQVCPHGIPLCSDCRPWRRLIVTPHTLKNTRNIGDTALTPLGALWRCSTLRKHSTHTQCIDAQSLINCRTFFSVSLVVSRTSCTLKACVARMNTRLPQ